MQDSSSARWPKPLNRRPTIPLHEIGRTPTGDGWQWVTYRGDDGNTYQAIEKGGIQERWILIPTDPPRNRHSTHGMICFEGFGVAAARRFVDRRFKRWAGK